MRVCVIGAGSLSLGLLCPWLASRSGVELSLVTRTGRTAEAIKARGGYRLDGSEDLVKVRALLRRGFFVYDPSDLEGERALACVAHLRETDVVVVSVGISNLPSAAALVARACVGANARPPLHLLAFENSPDASLVLRRAIETQLCSVAPDAEHRRLIAHRTIPDRACSRIVGDHEIVIRAERFSEIVLEDTAGDLFSVSSEEEASSMQVRFVAPDLIRLAEMRKFWLVNGTHTALGLLCHAAGLQLLADALERSVIRDLVTELHQEWVRVLHRLAVTGSAGEWDLFSEQSLATHAAALFERLRDMPDFSVLDVLKELGESKRGDVQRAVLRLIEKLDDRLGHQVRAAQEIGGVPVPASAWMLASGLHTVHRHARVYWQH